MGKVNLEYRSWDNVPLGVCPHIFDVTRTWVDGDAGTASFLVPGTVKDLDIIYDWNTIFVLHEDGKPPWIGIPEAQEWQNGNLQLSLKGAEIMLKNQITGLNSAFFGAEYPATIGQVAATLFGEAILRGRSPIRQGTMDASGGGYAARQWPWEDYYELLKKEAPNAGATFWVDENLRLHVRNQRGVDKTGTVVLYEGKHLTDVKIIKNQAERLTHLIGTGDGSKLQDKPIYSMYRRDWKGVHRVEVVNFSGVKTPEGLAPLVAAELRRRLRPRQTVDANVVNFNNIYDKFSIGDTIKLVLYAHGFMTWNYDALVTGMEIAADGTMRCVFEVVQSVDTSELLSGWVTQ